MLELLAAAVLYAVVGYPSIKVVQAMRRGDSNGLDIFVSLR